MQMGDGQPPGRSGQPAVPVVAPSRQVGGGWILIRFEARVSCTRPSPYPGRTRQGPACGRRPPAHRLAAAIAIDPVSSRRSATWPTTLSDSVTDHAEFSSLSPPSAESGHGDGDGERVSRAACVLTVRARKPRTGRARATCFRAANLAARSRYALYQGPGGRLFCSEITPAKHSSSRSNPIWQPTNARHCTA